MASFWQDIRYSLRMIAKAPGFAAIAIVTLALGIGANTALFSVVDGVLLNPLPFPQPQKLAALYERHLSFERASISYLNFLDWQRMNRSFASMAIYRQDDFTLSGMGDTERVKIEMVSSEIFPILDVHPALGRLLTADDDRLGVGRVVLISAGMWKRKFGATPDILGKTLQLNGDAYVVVGVIPASFRLSLDGFRDDTEIYTPIGRFDSDPLFRDRAAAEGSKAIGRLKPGVTLAQARADMDGVMRELGRQYPEKDKGIGATVIPLKEAMVGKIQPFLLMLFGAVFFVLLIACVNVANLLLARSTSRRREFAIRAAMGASQPRVIRQLLTESILLGLLGGGIGLLFAGWGTRAALGILPEALPRAESVGLDARVLLFTFLVSMIAGVVFGLAPAWKTAHPNLQEVLRESGRGGSGARHRTQRIFVAVEMAMALVLLIGAGLMIRSLAKIWKVDPGFQTAHLLTFSVSMPSELDTSPATGRAAIRELHRQIAAVPGVDSVSLTGGGLPMTGDSELSFYREGHPKPTTDDQKTWSLTYMVDADYLQAMGIPLKRGRFLSPQDDEHAPAAVVVDESFARNFFPGENPIGQRIHLDYLEVEAQIVGIVGHVKHWGLDRNNNTDIQAQMYIPYVQAPDTFWTGGLGSQVVVRTAADPAAVEASIHRAVETMNSGNVMFEMKTMDQIISEKLSVKSFSMIVLEIFAGLALLLASIGIYGVVSYVVGERTREIGIRIALGAQRSDVLRMILSEGAKLAMIGVGAGVVAALGLTRLMSQMLFGVSATDPLTFLMVAVALTALALAACYVPARRAMRVDPLVALRHE